MQSVTSNAVAKQIVKGEFTKVTETFGNLYYVGDRLKGELHIYGMIRATATGSYANIKFSGLQSVMQSIKPNSPMYFPCSATGTAGSINIGGVFRVGGGNTENFTDFLDARADVSTGYTNLMVDATIYGVLK